MTVPRSSWRRPHCYCWPKQRGTGHRWPWSTPRATDGIAGEPCIRTASSPIRAAGTSPERIRPAALFGPSGWIGSRHRSGSGHLRASRRVRPGRSRAVGYRESAAPARGFAAGRGHNRAGPVPVPGRDRDRQRRCGRGRLGARATAGRTAGLGAKPARRVGPAVIDAPTPARTGPGTGRQTSRGRRQHR